MKLQVIGNSKASIKHWHSPWDIRGEGGRGNFRTIAIWMLKVAVVTIPLVHGSVHWLTEQLAYT